MVVLLVVFVGLCWLLWGRRLTYDAERAEAVMRLEPRETISDRRLLLRVGVVLMFVLVGFVTHAITHLEPSLVALLGAGAAILVSRLPHAVYLEDVEWETLLFFVGLFVMVGSLVHQGVIGDLAETLTTRIGDDYAAAALGLLVGSAVLSGIVDNIPYVATMAPLVYELVGPAPGLPPAATVAVVGPRARRRPGRQRHGHRRQRERRGHSASPSATDTRSLLAVHQVRTRRHRRHDRAVCPLRRPALLRLGMRDRRTPIRHELSPLRPPQDR